MINGIQTINNLNVLSVDANPSAGLGTSSSVGSIALAEDGSGLYYKSGILNTNWSLLLTTSSASSTYVPYTGATANLDLGAFSLITPNLIGGSAVGSSITYKGTTANGTSTVSAHSFTVGNNGATTAIQIFNSGQVSIGNYASPTNLRALTVGQDTSYMSFGSLVGTTSVNAIYFNQASPSATNYSIYGSSTQTRLNASSDILLRIADATKFNIDATTTTLQQGIATSGAVTTFTFTKPNNTGQTASTPINGVLWTLGTRQWATGAITTQKEFELSAPTYSFVGASTITSAYTFYVNAPIAGTNATITNNYAIGSNGSFLFSDGTRSLGYVLAANSILTNTGDTSSQIKTVSGTRSINIQSYAADTNYIDASSSTLRIRTTTSNNIEFWTNGTARFTIDTSGAFIGGTTSAYNSTVATTGAVTSFTFTKPNNTGQTASTAINGVLWTLGSREWATGAITTQKEFELTSPTYTFTGASTITSAYTFYVNAPIASTNATITTAYAAGFNGRVRIEGIVNLGDGRIFSDAGMDLNAGSNSCRIFVGGAQISSFTSTQVSITPSASTSGSVSNFSFTKPNNTGQTASVGVVGFGFNTGSRQWATGAITNQYEFTISSPTYSFVGASTITNAYTLYVTQPTAGTNATITNNFAVGFAGNVKINDTFNLVFDTTNGTKIGTATTQKIGFWNATPIVQPTTAVAAATFAAVAGGTAVDTNDTFDGYSIGQVVRALRNVGILA